MPTAKKKQATKRRQGGKGRPFAKGGPPGPGRPKGVPNKISGEVRDFLASIFDGDDVREQIRERIVAELRDPASSCAVFRHLFDQAFGKARQSLEVEQKIDIAAEVERICSAESIAAMDREREQAIAALPAAPDE